MTQSPPMAETPSFTWLQAGQTQNVQRFLRERGWIDDDEQVVACDKAGEGNMNLTLRVRLAGPQARSMILKQARPWVEKYPDISAPDDRLVFEYRFYERTADIRGVGDHMPDLLGVDLETRTLLLEDLADARDFTDIYQNQARLTDARVADLARYLRRLHDATEGVADAHFANRAMRKLNHEHIFHFPLRENNGLKLDAPEPGLDAAAAALKRDEAYVRAVHAMGRRYLEDGPSLCHGDYFPGSWLGSAAGLRIIDAEFCYHGDREFDVGCAVAHFVLAGARKHIAPFLAAYADADAEADAHDGDGSLSDDSLASYAAAEVMRRLIGVAQLPIPPSDGRRADLLEKSRRAMLAQTLEPLCK